MKKQKTSEETMHKCTWTKAFFQKKKRVVILINIGLI